MASFNNIRIVDIAKILNVSVSTVSKSLKDSHEISEKTKKRVRAVAKKHNYQPNFSAVSLKNRSTMTIGVIIPDILNYFFVNALHGIEKEARANGYKMITCLSNEQHHLEVENLNVLANGSVDGLILSLAKGTQSSHKYKHVQNVINNNIPVVLFDRVTDDLNCDKIISDDFKGAYDATLFLINSGCKNIALITTHTDLSVVKLRKRGCEKALIENDLLNRKLVFNIDNLNRSEPIIQNFLASNNVDAVFTVDELLAIKVLKIANKLKYKVPNDLKVIGFADGELSKEYYPSLSTVDLHANEIGKIAAKTLLERLEQNKQNSKKEDKNVQLVPKTIIVNSKLIHRNSTNN
ncbi:LacI family DNA-binding transcriptional regulator [Urechidicola croceus]|uniref:HTH lacI-type domain-containing protein n=1 Tax=Urechidicola croceus TaxID=1850246 RepID=A0A1D8P595_9FLAO|nr:LacI family DNA-binding transcriptional regulator [Urechidicola croceus]AOW19748.1 hypothetical protein LPB138_03200 [Urechidicola croceus]